MEDEQHPEAMLRRMLLGLGLDLESFAIYTLSTDVSTLAVADVKINGIWYRTAVRHVPRKQETG